MAQESNMKISVSDYGPIAEAKDIELRPLTVFVGPSNTGKSYLAALIYALFNSLVFLWPHRRQGFYETDMRGTFPNIKGLLKDIEAVGKFSDFPEELKSWANQQIGARVSNNFQGELSRCMGIPAKTLMGKSFSIDFESKQKSLILELSDATCDLQINDPTPFKETGFIKQMLEADAWTFFIDLFTLIARSAVGAKSFYLPAARTGIMQSHRVIAGSLVQRATRAGLEPVSVPTLSGITSDFLTEIIYMDTSSISDVSVKKVADQMERNILHGSIKSENSEASHYPQFLYKQNGLEIPLLGCSSMVTELAPIVLFLKHRVEKGDLLIIEEPEAHLHPEAQRKIAETVVRLVRAGVRVMVTTHSDYFLDQLANHVRLSYLQGKQEAFLKFKNWPVSRMLLLAYLQKEEEIGAYAFKPQGKGGTVVERLRFDKETGFSPEDHNKVSSDLYNETVEILEQLDNTE